MIDLLSEPWAYEFMQRAVISAVIVAAAAAIVGSFIILKGMAFIGDSLPHASFGGVAVALTVGFNLQLGAAIAAVLSALTIGFIARRGSLRYDTAIGIVYVTVFAIGILLVSRQSGFVVDLFGFVFGNVLGVSWTDVWVTAGLSTFVLVTISLLYKEFLFTAYDPSMAAASGLRVELIQYGLLILIGLTVVAAMQVMGIVLVLAMLVAPAATAQLLTRTLPSMMALGSLVGVLSTVIGLYIAWYGDVSASAAIVLTTAFFFLLALSFTFIRGLVASGRYYLPGQGGRAA